MSGIERIAVERQRQIEVEGYDALHDDGLAQELALAATTYATPRELRIYQGYSETPFSWPWDDEWWKPSSLASGIKGRIRELEKAGALIAAAIDDLEGRSL